MSEHQKNVSGSTAWENASTLGNDMEYWGRELQNVAGMLLQRGQHDPRITSRTTVVLDELIERAASVRDALTAIINS